jgi:CcmD family protein
MLRMTSFSAFARDGQPTVEDRATQFVPVEGGGQTTSAEALLVAAYLVMWAILLGFVYMSWRRQRNLDSKLADLETRVSQRR